jgi:prepilin-type N-terminal cleavage/methylation domain-containing protein
VPFLAEIQLLANRAACLPSCIAGAEDIVEEVQMATLVIHRFRSRRRAAFTIVELLVVIAIIGVLVSILLPAVNATRDAARRTENSNNLKNIALAALSFEEAKKTYPPLVKFPTGVTPSNQNLSRATSWAFEILPHMEQQVIYDRFNTTAACSDPSNQVAMASPVPTYANPRRRDARAISPFLSAPTMFGMLLDYSANGGVIVDQNSMPVPLPNDPNAATLENPYQRKFDARFSGPFHFNLAVPQAAIRDGQGNTIAFGDRWIGPPVPKSGVPWNDLAGFAGESLPTLIRYANPDNMSAAGLPFPTGTDDPSIFKFGSVRGSEACFAFLDGRVTWIPYDIDPFVYRNLSSINDGNPIGELP